jgi:septum site-determining protein MinD
MSPEQNPLHRPRPSQGEATGPPWTQTVLQDLVEKRRTAAGAESEHALSVSPRPRDETMASRVKGGRHRTAQLGTTSRRARPEDTFDAATITSRLRHGEPLHRRGLRWVRTLTAGSRESIRLTELTTALHRPVTTGRRIAVTGASGGVGKTTVSLLVASILAARREDAVLALDADPNPGSLLWRAGLRSSEVAANVAEQLLNGRVANRDQLESLLPRTPGGLWVLGDPYLEAESPRTPIAVAHAVGRFFGVTVLDCGGDPAGWAVRGADTAHAAILVAGATVDGVRAMHLELEDSAQRPDSPLMRSVVALVSRTSTTEGVDLKAATKSLSTHGPQVVHIPYDRHLAVGAPIDLRRVGEPTLVAAMELAGVALALAVGQ